MAGRPEVTLIDDLDGNAADETVAFALDGMSYEIDLSTKHAEALRKAMASYVTHARRLGRSGPIVTRPRGTGPARSDREQNRAIRNWAKKEGIELAERGRIPGNIVKQFEERAGR